MPLTRISLLALAVSIAAALAGCDNQAHSVASRSGVSAQLSSSSATGSTSPCGRMPVAHYSHVVWIWMENKPYGSVIGNPSAPYENVLAKQCGSATDYHGVAHPSLPNYLAATGGSTFGVTNDDPPARHPIAEDSIFGQLSAAGLSWRSYVESMPRSCAQSSSGLYAVKHNPAAYYTAIKEACATSDVAFEGNFSHDIAAGTLPAFSFVTPNMCDDTHDCSVKTGDEWLATWIPRIVSGPNYQAGNTLAVLTWDEGVGSANVIPTIVVGPSVPAGIVDASRADHYAMLRTTEELLGLPPLGSAADAPSLRDPFHL
jgi:hypothetical protein